MLKNEIKNIVEKSIEKAIEKKELNLGDDYEVNLSVETPKKTEFGDFAVNISKLSKYARKSPVEIANILKNNLDAKDDTEIEIIDR